MIIRYLRCHAASDEEPAGEGRVDGWERGGRSWFARQDARSDVIVHGALALDELSLLR
jgi:hypothetical protein